MSLEVTGDLRAELKEEGQAIELVDARGKGALSYRKLIAVDAAGKQLAARMEARADGREIALVVNDQNATYPIVIDPITASSEQVLDGGTSRQTDARFGFAVAIDGDRAVVGAWRYDNGFAAAVDAGMVTKFTRTGSTWSYQGSSEGTQSNTACGWSVAISGSRFLFGCPGANSQAGRAELRDFDSGLAKQLTSAVRPPMTGDQFGYSVAISGTKIVVGLPFRDLESGPNNGGAFIFLINSGGDPAYLNYITHAGAAADSQLGTSVALDGDTLIVGEPGAGPGLAQVYAFADTGFLSYRATLQASDGGAGDNFGNSVDVSGNTAVVGAFGDDDKGTDAGAAYVSSAMRMEPGASSRSSRQAVPGRATTLASTPLPSSSTRLSLARQHGISSGTTTPARPTSSRATTPSGRSNRNSTAFGL